MLYRPLGRTGLTVSEIGFGCASWWGKPAFDEGTAISLVHEAMALGVTLFDTGASYSAGEAEPRLGTPDQVISDEYDGHPRPRPAGPPATSPTCAIGPTTGTSCSSRRTA